MGIVLTGHTSGIGKHIYEKYDCIGISRSNNFNIDSSNISNFLHDGCIFINNAFSVTDPFAQTRLLHEAVATGNCKKIINVGTNSVYISHYRSAKFSLEQASYDYYNEGLDIVLLKFGKVAVENQSHINEPKLDINYIISIFDIVIKSIYRIKCIDIRP